MRRVAQNVAGVVALFVLLLGGTVHAQSDGLGITPRKDYTIKAGHSVSDSLYLDNLSTKSPLTVTIRIIDFKAANESGTPSLMLAANAPTTPWSLKPFLHVTSSVQVAAGQNINIPLSIAIPANQGAGSYYSAIEYTAKSTSSKQSLTVTASSATLVFVTVPGKADELLSFEHFGAFIPNLVTGLGTYQSLFMGADPDVLAYTLQNNGNVAEQPTGTIVLKNTFGHVIKNISQANPKDSLALIGQARLFQACISPGQEVSRLYNSVATETVCNDPELLPGHYTAYMTLHYGINGGNNAQEITATSSFWYIPWWFVITVLVVIGSIVAAAWYGLRRYKQMEAKEAKRRAEKA